MRIAAGLVAAAILAVTQAPASPLLAGEPPPRGNTALTFEARRGATLTLVGDDLRELAAAGGRRE